MPKKDDFGKGHRAVTVKLKNARGRKVSSQKWLQRQLNDPYVQKAHALGYRSRAAFKLLEIQEKFHVLKPGMKVVDLGAAPGGWTQVLMKLLPGFKKGDIIALDILEMDHFSDVIHFQEDFTEQESVDQLNAVIPDGVDVVLSDMAPQTIGHRATDHLRIIALVELAVDFALNTLRPGGSFVAKVLQGGTQQDLLQLMRKSFTTIHHFKPPASRKSSPEMYVIAQGFKGPVKS